VERQHEVPALPVDAQMRREGFGFVAHNDITSSSWLEAPKPFPSPRLTLDEVNFSMFD
jgi:hypothetical protein